MEMSGSAAPKDTFTQSQTEGEAVRQTGFRFQGQCTAIDKRLMFPQAGTVPEQALSTVHILITQQSGKTYIQEHHLSRTGKEIAVVPGFPRILHKGDSCIPGKGSCAS